MIISEQISLENHNSAQLAVWRSTVSSWPRQAVIHSALLIIAFGAETHKPSKLLNTAFLPAVFDGLLLAWSSTVSGSLMKALERSHFLLKCALLEVWGMQSDLVMLSTSANFYNLYSSNKVRTHAQTLLKHQLRWSTATGVITSRFFKTPACIKYLGHLISNQEKT